jgi:hypothetical protein
MPIETNAEDALFWRTSSFCTNGACVEVAIVDESVLVRDSKDATRPALVYTRTEWQDFLAGVKGGEFDV